MRFCFFHGSKIIKLTVNAYIIDKKIEYNELLYPGCRFIRNMLTRAVFRLFLTGIVLGCNGLSSTNQSFVDLHKPSHDEFRSQWYAGQAEISRYKLEQVRYGAMHTGDAILIFVTEDFLIEKQVKSESVTADKAISVLKTNFIKKFTTGLYDYSMMMSVFTPVDKGNYPHSLKLTTSSQEWCGHTYLQLNLRNDNYELSSHSYFEKEADQQYNLPLVLLEDELWNCIRLNPSDLPTGKVLIVPGTMTARLRHIQPKAEEAILSLAPYSGYPGDNLMAYTIEYPELDRKLVIIFEGTFPYPIAGWEETYESGWGAKAKKLTTKAVRTHLIMTDYWVKNQPEDEQARKALGL